MNTSIKALAVTISLIGNALIVAAPVAAKAPVVDESGAAQITLLLVRSMCPRLHSTGLPI